ncbi:class I SAM-dependent methyltransferase [Brooklawnia cerclae]|uniref:SAM-dependent methyltransferase n=1 Tax=Brooklawnia cerclae TaxID=349934 RepID=A0ABX0SHX7_9ACTN|nr:class I SAM-dependent methyltransferase [Brooklawnia cerclae]NIH58008.1 SAM-dependent methyltransferase [Brooklawnia cerclae]
MSRRLTPTGWADFIADFHQRNPGIAEEVLSRALSGRQNPYQWMARAVSSGARVVLDIGCGSGRVSRELSAPDRVVVGLDLSRNELRLAAERSSGPWVQADARRLPFADGSLDAVTTVMGLAVIRPISEVLDEVARVLRPGGVFVSVAPTIRPQRTRDVRVAARVTQLLRGTPRFPRSPEVAVGRLMEGSGLMVAEDRRERYGYRVTGRDDAERLLGALYLPGTSPERMELAVDYLTERAGDGFVEIPIPMRRIVAVK